MTVVCFGGIKKNQRIARRSPAARAIICGGEFFFVQETRW